MSRKIDAEDARQGKKGRPVLFVLILSLALALLVWALVEFYGGMIAPEEPVGGAPTEQPADQAAPPPAQPPSEPPAQPPVQPAPQ